MRRFAPRALVTMAAVAGAVILLLVLLSALARVSLLAQTGPDLTVASISVDPPLPGVSEPCTVTLVVENQGDSSASGFETRLYVDPTDRPPLSTTQQTALWGYFVPLPAGGSVGYGRQGVQFDSAGCDHVVYGWVDRDDDVAEAVETNNVLSQTVCVGVECEPDAYEEDDACSAAQWITNTMGIAQHRSLCPVGDEDWARFSAQAGITYTIEATNLGAHSDPLLSLYQVCGGVKQYGTGPSIEWQAPSTGLYYVQVIHREEEYGPLSSYDLSITADSSGAYDPYEPDDTCATARDISTNGTRQTHYFQVAGDLDWVKFPVQSGDTYFVTVDNTAPGVSPQVTLFSSCAQAFGQPLAQGPSVEAASASGGMFYARVDNLNAGVHGPDAHYDLSVTASACVADAQEEDDSAGAANQVAIGATNTHNVCPVGDQDWIKFDAISGTTYLLETSNLGPDADTELALYDTDGTTELDRNDDYAIGLLNSRIIWQAPAAGTYYALVHHVKASAAGTGTRYDLSVSEGACLPDANESLEGDNGPLDAASAATDGSPQTHNFCPLGDQDWVKFEAPAAGTTFTIQTSQLGPQNDTVLSLYGPDGITVLASSDDVGVGGASLISYTAPSAGTYYVRVLHFNSNNFGSGTSYDLSVDSDAPPTPTPTATPSPTPLPTPTPTPVPNDVQALILTNRARIETLYGSSAASQVMTKLFELAFHPRVQGLVVQLDLAPSVAAAYSAWTADEASLLDTTKANDVASAVRNVVVNALQSNPDVEHILIVGDDRIVPFRRMPDLTASAAAKEDTYAASVTISTTQWAACRDSMILTDDYYGDEVPTSWTGGELYLPDYPIGRLIEEPDEIIATIDAFLTSDGTVGSKALVTGYDFVQDGAGNVKTYLVADSITTDSSLIASSWSGSQLRSKQLDSSPRFDIQSINGHANHTTEIAPDSDNVTASEISTSTSDLAGAIVFTVGCHAGFNDSGTLDLAQAFAQKQANYVANTGYGYGGGGMSWSEALMFYYAYQLLQGQSTEMGTALAEAKAFYYSQDAVFDAYDQKILNESTFYGLPMYAITSGGTLDDDFPFPSVGFTPTLPSGSLGDLNEGHLQFGLPASFGAYEEITDTQDTFFGEGSFFALDDVVHAAAGEPIQPKFFADVSAFDAGTLRGVLFLGGVYTDVAGFDPVIVQPINEYVTPTGEPEFEASGWYPPVPFGLTNHDSVLGASDTVVTVMGQFDSGADTERLYEALSLDTYYSSDPDTEAPIISYLNGVLDEAQGQGTIKVEANDASGIVRVVVAYTEGQFEWFSHDLEYNAEMHKWEGQIPATSNTVYFVQVVDGAGNVRVTHNKGIYYSLLPPAQLVEGGQPGRLYLPLTLRD